MGSNLNSVQCVKYFCEYFFVLLCQSHGLQARYQHLLMQPEILSPAHDDVIKWKHFSALLALCAGNFPVTGEFPSRRSVTRSFNVFFALRLNKRLSKESCGWWFETPWRSLWCHCNGIGDILVCKMYKCFGLALSLVSSNVFSSGSYISF